MGVYQQIKDKFIMKNAWADWKAYRNEMTDIIISQKPQSVMIVGAGRCNDIDLKRLAAAAEKVVCVDVDEGSMSDTFASLPNEMRSKVECRTLSLTGISEGDMESFCDEMLSFVRKEGRRLTLDSFEQKLMCEMDGLEKQLIKDESELAKVLGTGSADVTLCCGVHSQLFTTLSFFIRSLISSLNGILSDAGKIEHKVNERIHGMNDKVIPVIIRSLVTSSHKTVFGNEYMPENPVEGAHQCITYIRENMNPEEQHLTWEFNRAEGITYDMLIQKCKGIN